MLKGKHGVAETSQLAKNQAEISPKIRVVRLELHCLVNHLQGLVEATNAEQGLAERCQIGRVWVLPDGPEGPFYRMVELFPCGANDCHDVHSFSILGIQLESLPGAGLCLRELPTAHVLDCPPVEFTKALRFGVVPAGELGMLGPIF
jgi:hypothetical protein